jgi:uncharacterized protein (DUF58 family)
MRLWPLRSATADRARRADTAVAARDREDISRHVRSIELNARRLMDSRALGAYDSVFRGHGIEFAEVRAYQPGDPFQSIDWKVTARMRHPYVKRFVEERELTVLLVVDISGSTAFGTRWRLKRELAAEVAGILGLAATRNNDRLGLVMFTDRLELYVPPRRGRNRLLRSIHDLLTFQPEGRGTDVRLAVEAASRLLRVRSLVFLISDFMDSGFDRPLLGLARRHDVVAIDVHDPAEKALPAAGLLEVVDPETGTRGIADLGDSRARTELARRGAEQRERVRSTFRRCGVDHISLSTDRPYVPELAAFFAARARAKRR